VYQQTSSGGNVTQVQSLRKAYFCRVLSAMRFPRHEPTALTYVAWVDFVLGRDMRGESTQARVQFIRRGVKGCGVVVDANPGDQASDWFQVRANEGGQCWLPAKNVRLCSGDGRCTCEAAAAAGGAPACGVQPAAKAVPPGNTGTTVVVKA